jgi:hypothetical protein
MLALHRRHPMPSVGAGLQRRLLDAILSHQPDDAVAIFRQGCLDFEQNLSQGEADGDPRA